MKLLEGSVLSKSITLTLLVIVLLSPPDRCQALKCYKCEEKKGSADNKFDNCISGGAPVPKNGGPIEETCLAGNVCTTETTDPTGDGTKLVVIKRCNAVYLNLGCLMEELGQKGAGGCIKYTFPQLTAANKKCRGEKREAVLAADSNEGQAESRNAKELQRETCYCTTEHCNGRSELTGWPAADGIDIPTGGGSTGGSSSSTGSFNKCPQTALSLSIMAMMTATLAHLHLY